MSTNGFTFPPPPPPPPRKDFIPGDGPSYNRGNRGGSFNRGGDRGGGSRSRGRGFGGRFPRGNPFSNQRGAQSHSSSGPLTSSIGFIAHREWSQGYSNHGTSPDGATPSKYGSQQSKHQPGRTSASSSGTYHSNATQKRDHATAFNHRGRGGSKPPAAPAVPSFLANIPGLSPSPPSDITPVVTQTPVEKKAKPRTFNILGLNPSSQGPESDEDDEDEEANLASSTTKAGIAFEHNGLVATLKTPAEIAAWIADRKKRFPTAAKAAQAKKEAQEKQRKWEEEKKANQEARRLQRESYESEKVAKLQAADRGKKVAAWLKPTEVVGGPSEETHRGVNAAEKAKLKTEKLIEKAAKVHRKLKKAQDALRKAQVAATPSATAERVLECSDDGLVDGVLTGEPAPKNTSEDHPNKLASNPDDSDASSVLTSMDSDDGENDEDTSSSGSSSDSDSDSSAAPELLTAKRTTLDRVAPPPRVPTSTTSISTHLVSCRNMMKYGRCNAGKKCRFSHDPSPAIQGLGQAKGGGRDTSSGVMGRSRRKGLWEMMVEKEKEEEAKVVMGVIVQMGEGALG